EVGRKQANAFGLFDMHGNVYELCSDGYDGRYYSRSPLADPCGPSSRDTPRAHRGGCWNDYPRHLRAARRVYVPSPANDKSGALGFRVARGTSERRGPDTAGGTGGSPTSAGGAGNPRVGRPPVPVDQGQFVLLFNGKDLTGWKVDRGESTVWRVEGGHLVADG